MKEKKSDSKNGAFVPNPNGTAVESKVERYGWKMRDLPGQIAYVNKTKLQVDHSYQRDTIANGRILSIASDWSWLACGCLLVAQRADGSLWVYDGQHRKLAADRRSDITTLPCLVFQVENIEDEAEGFYLANTMRGAMKSVDKFKALLRSNDPVAIGVDEMVQKTGYRVSATKTEFTVASAARLTGCFSQDESTCRAVWSLSVDIFTGQPMDERIFGGLYYLERYLRSKCPDKTLARTDIHREMVKQKPKDLLQSIAETAAFYRGNGGMKVWAEGIVRAFNRGRRSLRLPQVIAEEDVR